MSAQPVAEFPYRTAQNGAFSAVLAGTDGSARAEEAVWQAAAIARAEDALLEVVFVHDRLEAQTGQDFGEGEAAAKEILDRACRVARRAGTEATARLFVGRAAEMLAREAGQRWADLVVVGADAPFLEKPHLLGGVAAHVAREATVSVLVARSPSRKGGSETFPRRILCAVDGSPESDEAVRRAATLALAVGAELRLLHVVPVFQGHSVGWTVAADPDGFEPLAPAVALAEGHGIQPAREMAMGRPAPTIARVAQDEDSDLIVVGSHGRRGLSRILLGSVSEWLVHHTSRSVLVVRAPSLHH